jgi:TRAP-type C4-dicarboxylate transport system permease small subunit
VNEAVSASGHPQTDGPTLPAGLASARRLLIAVGKVELFLAVVALVLVVVVSGAQAILRYTIDASLWWAQESAQLTIVIAYFFGISYMFKARQYILIEFFSMRFSVRVQMYMYIFAQILAIIFTVTCFVLLIRFAPSLMGMTTPTLGLPDMVRVLPFGIGSAMIAVTSVYYLAFAVWVLRSGVKGGSVADLEQMALLAGTPEDLDS